MDGFRRSATSIREQDPDHASERFVAQTERRIRKQYHHDAFVGKRVQVGDVADQVVLPGVRKHARVAIRPDDVPAVTVRTPAGIFRPGA